MCTDFCTDFRPKASGEVYPTHIQQGDRSGVQQLNTKLATLILLQKLYDIVAAPVKVNSYFVLPQQLNSCVIHVIAS